MRKSFFHARTSHFFAGERMRGEWSPRLERRGEGAKLRKGRGEEGGQSGQIGKSGGGRASSLFSFLPEE